MPKSEINALVLCTRLTKTVVTSMPVKPVTVLLVGDSDCVIHTLEKGTALNSFFYNRVMEIEENKAMIEKYTVVENVHHCRSDDNAADLATRDKATLEDLKLTREWLSGPSYLSLSLENWPFTQDFLRKELLPDIVRGKTGKTENID